MRAFDFDILGNVGGTYDQTRTTILGRMSQLNIGGIDVLSPPRNAYIDTLAISGVTPLQLFCHPSGYIFAISATSSPLICTCYQFNFATGAVSYVGRVNLNQPTGTVTVRGFKVIMGSGRAWIFLATTNATAANGGTFFYNTLLSDFVPVGFPTIALAGVGETSALKRGFFLQETNVNGGAATHLNTASIGLIVDEPSNFIYVMNGSAAVYQVYRFNPAATLTSTSAAGVTTDAFTGANGFKTGNLPALAGTALLTNSVDFNVIGHGPNAGFNVITFGTTTNMYNGRLSDLAASVTTWPTLETTNNNGALNDQIPISATHQNFSGALDGCFIAANGRFYFKKFINNQIEFILGATDSDTYENLLKEPRLGIVVLGAVESRSGWLFTTSSTAGQRGIFAIDVQSHGYFESTAIVSKVLDLKKERQNLAIQLSDIFRGSSGGSIVEFRTSGFSSVSGGWTALPESLDAITISPQSDVQLRLRPNLAGNKNAIHPAITNVRIITNGLYESSDNWRLNVDNTSRNSESPVTIAARLVSAYSGGPQTVGFRIFDSSGSLLASLNTSANFSQFRKSSDGGLSFTPMSGPNDYANVGDESTVIQLIWSSPTAGVVVATIQEI